MRGVIDFFGHFDFADALSGAASVAAILELHALEWERRLLTISEVKR